MPSAGVEWKKVDNLLSRYTSQFGEPDAYVSVTRWGNGEGFDVEVSSDWGSRLFSLTWTDWEVMKEVITAMEKK